MLAMDLPHITSQDKSLPENKAVDGGPPAHMLEETKSKNSPVLNDGPMSGGGQGAKPHDGSSKQDALDSRSVDADFPPDRNGQHHPIAEFLYQLTKMLTDDNSEIIEWSDGRIKVHHPERLESEVLHKYFRHSKFASFQRQLNYFGFRKMAGKGKMSPCSYVNEAATTDIRSLLLIKRKTNGSAARKAAMEQRAAALANPINNSLLGMNLLSAANQGAVGAGGVAMNSNNLSNAMALLSENALRAGLGQLTGGPSAATGLPSSSLPNTLSNTQLSLLALQQQQQQLQQQLQQQQQSEQLKQLVQQQQNQLSTSTSAGQVQQSGQSSSLSDAQPTSVPSNGGGDNSGNGKYSNAINKPSNTQSMRSPSLEQLHAQLAASLAATQKNQQQLGQQPQLLQSNINNNTDLSSINFGNMPTTAALKFAGGAGGTDNPATAALQAQGGGSGPATAAMNASQSNQQTSNNLFDSALNLKSLLQEHQESVQQAAAAAQSNATTQALLRNRLPSSSAIFPDAAAAAAAASNSNALGSTVSIGNLLGSSNRLNSLLSLNSFMGSREASLADFAGVNNMAQQLQQQQGAATSAAQMQAQMQMAAAANAQALQAEAARLRNQ